MGEEIAERPSRKRRLLAGLFVAATLAMGAGLIGAGGASADQGNAGRQDANAERSSTHRGFDCDKERAESTETAV